LLDVRALIVASWIQQSIMNPASGPSLYEQLGGEAAVDAAVDVFYRKVLSDDRVSSFFDDIDMDQQIAKQKAFLTMVFGGPVAYSGKDMRNGHARLLAKGLNDSHVNAVIELLGESLREVGAPEHLIAKVASIAESARADVLNR
jgi:hemoglobin